MVRPSAELETGGFATAAAYRAKEMLRWIRQATSPTSRPLAHHSVHQPYRPRPRPRAPPRAGAPRVANLRFPCRAHRPALDFIPFQCPLGSPQWHLQSGQGASARLSKHRYLRRHHLPPRRPTLRLLQIHLTRRRAASINRSNPLCRGTRASARQVESGGDSPEHSTPRIRCVSHIRHLFRLNGGCSKILISRCCPARDISAIEPCRPLPGSATRTGRRQPTQKGRHYMKKLLELRLGAAALGVIFAAALWPAAPALADPPPWAPAHGWREKHERHDDDDWRVREWRRHQAGCAYHPYECGYPYPGAVYVAPPPPVVIYPAPPPPPVVFAPAPSLDIVVPIHIR